MRYEDVLAEDFRDERAPITLTRRELIAAAGGILVLFRCLEGEAEAQHGGRDTMDDWNAFVRVGADGRITAFTGKVELGQGIHTALVQIAADEMNAPYDKVDIVMGDTDLCPWDMGTFGSRTIRFYAPLLREACAEARGILTSLAADKLQVPAGQLMAKDGRICLIADPKRGVTYAELTQGQRIEKHLNPRPAPEAPEQYTVVGKPQVRRDGRDKLTGAAQYSGDIRVPGMLYARILRPPAHGARLVKADLAAARAMPAVRVVEQGDLVAVLADRPDRAEAALESVKADWDVPKSDLDQDNIFDHLLATAGGARTVDQGGDLQAGERAAVQLSDETYTNAYIAHAPMEPHAAVVQIDGDKVNAWVSTQRPFGCKDELARVLGVPPDRVRVRVPFVGGGFGGKSPVQQAVEAARLAKATGKPVMVAWTREEEFFYDTYRPAAVIKIRSGVDGQGKIVLWDYTVYNAGERGAPHFYAIPNHRTRGTGGQSPLATGSWRAPGNNSNTYAREQQIDVMAVKAGLDPVEFRLRNLAPDAPARGVLEAAAKMFGYQPAKGPSGRGIGVAVGTDVGSWVAHIAQVKVDRATGKVKVERVVCAQDCGRVINPVGARMQMEGCIAMGLGYALREEIKFRNGGEVLTRSFADYRFTHFSDLPKIEVTFVNERQGAPQGGGEPAIICMGAVIANAVHDALGVRLHHLPASPERVLAALRAGK